MSESPWVLLWRLEWSGSTGREMEGCCPVCGATSEHDQGCWLGRALVRPEAVEAVRQGKAQWLRERQDAWNATGYA